MEQGTKCGVCEKRDAVQECEKCGVPLCHECVKEVTVETVDPGQKFMGVSTSPLKPSEKKWKVCEKCMQEEDFF